MALLDNLVAYYKTEDTTDEVGGFDLTNNNSVAFNSGKINNAADFGASNSDKSLSIANNLGISGDVDISLNAWVNVTTAPTGSDFITAVSHGNASNDVIYGIQYFITSGTLKIRFQRLRNGFSDDDIQVTQTLTTGTWYMMTLTYDATNNELRGYLNGAEVTGSPATLDGAGTVGISDAFLIGHTAQASVSQWWEGLVDEVSVWSKELNQYEINHLYNGGTGQTYPFTTFFPDPDTEVTSVDGYAARGAASEETYSTRRSAAGDQAFDNSPSNLILLTRSTATTDRWDYISRLVTLFDTSSIPDSNTVTAATLSLYLNTTNFADNFNLAVGVDVPTTAAATSLTTADYNIANWTGTRRASDIDVTSLSSSAYNDWALNASGLSAISKTGITYLGFRHSSDIDNSITWSSNLSSRQQFDSADDTNDPKLVVTHSAASASPSASPSTSPSASPSTSPSASTSPSISPSASISGLTSSLAGYWKLDDALTDSSGNGLTLTGSGSPSYAAGVINNGIDLDSGSSQFLYRNDGDAALDITGDIAIQAWVIPGAQPGTDEWHVIVSKWAGDTNNGGYLLSYNDVSGTKKIRFGASSTGNNGEYYDWEYTLSNGSMYHIVVSWDASASTGTLWVNGADQGDVVGAYTAIYNNNTPFKIGAAQNTSTFFFDGVIDEVGLWAKTLTDANVAMLYNNGNGLSHDLFDNSASPSISPSASPSTSPSISPSTSPSISPSTSPSISPSTSPSISPSISPSASPSTSPSESPSESPSPAAKARTIISDNFNRADAGSWGTASGGGAWTQIGTGGSAISSNTGTILGINTEVRGNYHDLDTQNDLIITFVAKSWVSVKSGDVVWIMVRANGGNRDGFGLEIGTGTSNNLIIRDSTTYPIATESFTFSDSTNYNFEIDIAADNAMDIYIWDTGGSKPGTPTISGAAASRTGAGTKFAFGVSGNSSPYETLTVDDLVVTTDTFYPDPDTEVTTMDARTSSAEAYANWAAAVADTTAGGTSDSEAEQAMARSGDLGGGSWAIYRSLFLFDTSSIPDSNTITAATFSTYGSSIETKLDNDNASVVIVSSAPASNTSVASSDMGNYGSTSFGSIDITDFSLSAYNDFTLNASGIANISKTGVSKFGARTDLDINVTTPSSTNRVNIHFADETGTSQDPKLVVTHSAVSESPSTSPSISPSTSPSTSPSISPSISPSTSPSISPSVSPSTSISPSVSPSISPSVSPSESPSVSPSVSPSPSLGYELYTRGDEAALPGNDNSLETSYSAQDYLDVNADDSVRVSQSATAQYAIHQFKDFIGSSASVTLRWNGQTNTACTWSTAYLQIYNRNSTTWETVDSDSTTAADTDFDLTGTIADTTNYKDASNVISCRVYQLAV